MNQKEINERIVNRIVELINQGVTPWHKGWKAPSETTTQTNNPTAYDYAYNYITNKPYNGINQMMLNPGYYLTFKEIKELNATLKKGSKGNFLVYCKQSKRDATNEELEIIESLIEPNQTKIVIDRMLFVYDGTTWTTTFTFLKEYYVFNIKDCENLKPIKNRLDFDNPIINKPSDIKIVDEFIPNEKAEDIINNYINYSKIKFNLEFQYRAFYRPSTHSVTLPLKKQFYSQGEYYGTCFHELVHSTGHSSLLNRNDIVNISNFGTINYSKEELIAEMGSTFITSFLNINTDSLITNSASYLKGWASHLKTELKSSLMSAFTHAQKAFDLIIGFSR